MTRKWYATLRHHKMYPHNKFGIPASKNVGDMHWTLSGMDGHCNNYMRPKVPLGHKMVLLTFCHSLSVCLFSYPSVLIYVLGARKSCLLSVNIYFGYSKCLFQEPVQRDSSFEHPKHVKTDFIILRTICYELSRPENRSTLAVICCLIDHWLR